MYNSNSDANIQKISDISKSEIINYKSLTIEVIAI